MCLLYLVFSDVNQAVLAMSFIHDFTAFQVVRYAANLCPASSSHPGEKHKTEEFGEAGGREASHHLQHQVYIEK